MFVFVAKLNRLKKTLIPWNRTQFEALFHNIKTATNQIEDAEIKAENVESQRAKEELCRAKARLNKILVHEAMVWKQRTNLRGDNNTVFSCLAYSKEEKD